jgi:pyruvate/2-oxoglutarate dehydrogenase complex dihydrolipoamide acyltransferase (E2) component
MELEILSFMLVELRLPNLDLPGVSVTACSWHAQTGQRVIEGDRLLEILAGDVTVDLPAPTSGVLIERRAEVDRPLKIGEVLAVIEAEE